MKRSGRWNNVVGLLGLAACALAGVWLFRFGILVGLIGLNVAKHVGVAVLCQVIGVGKPKLAPGAPLTPTFRPAHLSIPRPHSLAKDAR